MAPAAEREKQFLANKFSRRLDVMKAIFSSKGESRQPQPVPSSEFEWIWMKNEDVSISVGEKKLATPADGKWFGRRQKSDESARQSFFLPEKAADELICICKWGA